MNATAEKNVGTKRRLGGMALTLLSLGLLLGAAFSQPAAALNLTVLGTNNTAIGTYKYIINVDNTGTNAPSGPTGVCSSDSPGYPNSCPWTSIKGIPNAASPIYTQGDQSDIAGVNPPPGRYLISVRADGYKLDGEHFTVSGASPPPVTVLMQPMPLPTATAQALVFEDNAPVDGAFDVPAERGLAGFEGHIVDYIDEVTTDVFGNPLCTEYTGNNPDQPIAGSGGRCLSKCYIVDGGVDVGTVPPIDAAGRCPTTTPDGLTVEGKVKIPNIGTNRYSLSVVPPTGSTWVQTTTLEGNHDWDVWLMEGATGLDTEFALAGEPIPNVPFGFVQPTNALGGGGGQIKGVVTAVKAYTPPQGGVAGLPGTGIGYGWGIKIDRPINSPWIALSDLGQGDAAVWVGRGNANGSFTIPNVPDGNYMLTWWDDPQDYALDIVNVTVSNGELVDMAILPLLGWWTQFEGYVFNDTNSNGKKDPGETGVPNFPVALKKRENSLMDRGGVSVTTDSTGHYYFENAYPLGQWVVMEAYADNVYTTGVTYQADNQPTETTVLGAGVDVSVYPVIGLAGRIDWGVHAYAPGTNGGIVGTVSYDTTRNELDPKFAAVEDWQPGVPNFTVKLYQPVPCGTNDGAPCDVAGVYELASDGSIQKGPLLNAYLTETWQRPTGCVARDSAGNEISHGPNGEQVLPTDPAAECLEGPLMSVQFGPGATDQGTPAANFGEAVDGNYGFGDGCFVGILNASDPSAPVCSGGFTPLPAGDYLVEVENPTEADVWGGAAAHPDRPLYQFTREEDINIFTGDQFVPQIPPPECAGPLHTVDVADDGIDGYPPVVIPDPSEQGGGDITVPASTPVDNPDFADPDAGGSPYEGQQKPLCSTKLVRVSDRRSVAPTFNVFTDVPIPGRHWFLIVDDINFSYDPRTVFYGEKAGIPNLPVGIYDYTNRLITTVNTDFNGLFDVLLPSTNRISCPTPSGVCSNVYRYVGNDPGIPGRLNPNYNPAFRTIGSEFEVFPGLIVPADLAPTQVGVTIELPGAPGIQPHQVSCALDSATPQLFQVSRPYVNNTGSVTIKGIGFGATGVVYLDGTAVPTTSWSDTQIVMNVTAAIPTGPHQLSIVAANGQKTVDGLTFHVLRAGYNPTLFEVFPGGVIQNALEAAAGTAQALVVVYPGTASSGNPRGAYYENLVIHSPVKLQGVGPGGFQGNTFVPGSIIDAGAFGGDTALADAWRTLVVGLTRAGNQTIYEAPGITVFAQTTGQFTAGFRAGIDGFDLRGGNQQGFPTNLDEVTGLPTGLPPEIQTQGGAVYVNGYAHYLQITNNVIENNGGAYATVRIGTPNLPAPDTNQHNDNLRIANNRIIHNAGTNLAGAVGIFSGADSYEVAYNDLCGNFSAEYGGAISVFGNQRNPPSGTVAQQNAYVANNRIHDNRIYFNRSYDEGGGVMIAGELPANPGELSPGSGPVDIFANLIGANLANDDGGGLRFLMASSDCNAGPAYGPCAINVYNNFIVNNVSTHEGGGIALDDAPNVRVYNNTIMKNMTTATAVTSNGQPAPAGLSTTANSAPLQAVLPAGSPTFSDPLLFNDIFWDNRAGTLFNGTVSGLGLAGAGDIDHWDIGAFDDAILLAPTYSVLQQDPSHPFVNPGSSNNIGSDPLVVAPFDVSVTFTAWRTNPRLIGAFLVAADLPPNLMGNYHIQAGSPAINVGAAAAGSVNAPADDFDHELRNQVDIGADERPAPTPPTQANLGITKTDGLTNVAPGGSLTYTIVVSNAGPSSVTGATVTDTLPASLTCTGGNINQTVNLAVNASTTITRTCTVAANASGTLSNTATVSAPAGVTDPTPGNNSATDTTQIGVPIIPTLTLLDNFNRGNSGTLGGNWSQPALFGQAIIRVNNQQAFSMSVLGLVSQAYWNGAGNNFGANQGAAFTFANGTLNNSSLLLKATGGTAASRQNAIRVQYQTANGGQVVIATTTNSGASFATQGTISNANFASGNRLTARVDATGKVYVWKTNGGTTYLGFVQLPNNALWTTGGGRIGMNLPTFGARVDNFAGGTLP